MATQFNKKCVQPKSTNAQIQPLKPRALLQDILISETMYKITSRVRAGEELGNAAPAQLARGGPLAGAAPCQEGALRAVQAATQASPSHTCLCFNLSQECLVIRFDCSKEGGCLGAWLFRIWRG